MSEPVPGGPARPDPRRIVTRRDFGAELTIARRASGFSVRRVARETKVPASTLGGYFAGAHLPALQPPDLLGQILRVLGITDGRETAAWWEAYWRVRGPSAGNPVGDERPDGAAALAMMPAAVSTRPPLDRLLVEPHLRGRDELLATLDGVVMLSQHLHPVPRVHVLHGLGGSGKSMVALTVAQRAEASNMRTFWICANDESATFTGMRALAVELGATADSLRGASLPDVVWRLLLELDEPWLLVFDNADDPSRCLALPGHRLVDGTGWLRSVGTGLGTVLVSTRDGHSATWGEPAPAWLALHRLAGLGRDDGAGVLAELAGPGVGDLAAAADLSERLGGLPLALMLAGRLLGESKRIPAGLASEAVPCTFSAYLEALRHGRHADLFAPAGTATTPAGQARSTAGLTWDLSVSSLQDRGLGHARPLLHLLACFGATAIPYGMLLRVDVLAGSPLFPGLSARGLWDALCGLDSLGLITMSGADGGAILRIHPFVRDLVRGDEEVRADVGRYLGLAAALVSSVVREAQPKLPASWARWRLLADHCTEPLDLLGAGPVDPATVRTLVEVAGSAATYLRAAGHAGQAELAFGKVVGAVDRRLDPRDATGLSVRHEFARLRYDQGRLAEAEELYRSVLAARRGILGEQHPDTLSTQYYLVRTLRARGSLDEAEELCERTYSAHVLVLGERHPNTLTSRHGLADLLRDRGFAAQALDVYLQVLALRVAVLGEHHPATLVTRQYAAEMRHALDDLDLAESELHSVWAATREIRGLDHPRTLACGQALVNLLHDRGKLDEAEALAVAVVSARRRLLGDTHPATLGSRHRLGLIRLDRGDATAAHQDLLAVLIDRRQAFGSSDPATDLSRRVVEAVQRRVDPDLTADHDIPSPTSPERSTHGGTR